MSIRSQWCEYDKETRKYIKKRDNNKCIFCGNNGALQIAHIFLSRAHGGKGCKENGVMLCIKCHQELDNGKDTSLRNEIHTYCAEYLVKKENILSITELMKTLKYDKKNNLGERIIISEEKKEIKDRCKNCRLLEKRQVKSNSILTYYCRYRKIRITKNVSLISQGYYRDQVTPVGRPFYHVNF